MYGGCAIWKMTGEPSSIDHVKWQWLKNGPFRFPGSQPVSFGVKDLAKLENQE
jgi:hypothetical protein